MKLFFDDLDLMFDLNDIREEKVEKSGDFLFDDEPLEQILYGQNPNRGPTRANLYLSALECVRRIRRAYLDENIRDALEKAAELSSKAYPISKRMCFSLAVIMKGIVPNYPNPIIEFDLSALRPLLEQMWNLALRTEDKELQQEVGVPLSRWYEHHHRYQDARRVLRRLIELGQEKRNPIDEAIMLNNFAFEYLLEERWQDAIPFFEKATKIFKENADTSQYANSRANYWICRVECDNFEEAEKVETEVKVIAKLLDKNTAWHTRKPLILLAKIEEKRGNINAAIRLVKRAIRACEKSNTRYPELDAKYLKYLTRKQVV